MKKRRYELTVPGLGSWKFYADGDNEADRIVLDMIKEIGNSDRVLTEEEKSDAAGDEMLDRWQERDAV